MAEALLQLREAREEEEEERDVESLQSFSRAAEPEMGTCTRVVVKMITRLLQIVITLLFIASLLCLAILCSPCILCLCIHRVREGRTVMLDGTQPPDPDPNTRSAIEQAQAESFHAEFVNSFARPRQQFGQLVSTINSQRSLNLESYAIEEERLEGGVDALRVQLKEDRMNAYESQRKDKREPPLPGYLNISVSREELVQQSLQCIGSPRYYDLLAKHLSIKFAGEQGIDAGGVARDWFDSLGRSLATAAEQGDGHLMVLPDNTLFPRPYEDRFTDLYAIGRVLGLAVWFGISVPISLGNVACKFILDQPISPADVRRLDPDFYKFRVEPVLRQGVHFPAINMYQSRTPGGVTQLEEALCEPLMFVSAATDLRESKELCEGGAYKQVDEENKLEYVKMLCDFHLCGDMQGEINAFLQGFWDILPKELLKASSLSYRELAILIAGYSELDPHEWQLHSEVNCSSEYASLVSWFWEMVGDMSNEERAKLLHFTTGSSRLPASGFAGMSPSFNIDVQRQDEQHLPQSHTCGNQLVLPAYHSKEVLVDQMRIALQNDEGFGFL